MSTTLTTFTHRTPTGAGRYRVHWRVGVHQQGAFEVNTGDLQDGHLAAEMTVIHEMLFRRGALGDSRISAKGVSLVVSAGAIPKLVRKDSAKVHLGRLATPLALQTADAAWRVSHAQEWIKPEVVAEGLDLPEELRPVIKVPGLGEVHASLHAVYRLCSRSSHQSLTQGWRNLHQIFGRNRLRAIQVSRVEQDAAIARHGFSAEKFLDPETGWVFVMRRHPARYDLLTAYAADGNQRLNSARPTTAPMMRGTGQASGRVSPVAFSS